MTVGHQGSFWFGLAHAIGALLLAGCAATESPRSGQLELRLDPEASYGLLGRFQVNAIEPWNPSRDIDFDPTTSQARIELPAGTFSLALGAGARLVCAGEALTPSAAPSAAARLVSASPRVISIAPGAITTARISFGVAPSRGADPLEAAGEDPMAVSHSPGAADPCGTRVAITDPLADWQ